MTTQCEGVKNKLLALGKFISDNPEFYTCNAAIEGWDIYWSRCHGAFELRVGYDIHYKPTPHRPHGTTRKGYFRCYQSNDVQKIITAAIYDLPEKVPTKADNRDFEPRNLDGLEFRPDLQSWEEEEMTE